MAKKNEAIAVERDFVVIREPVVTEKSTMGSQYGQVTFRVAIDATKPQIKQAVETLFKVKVKKVNTLITKGKTKRARNGIMGKTIDIKKAMVTLEEGQVIDTGIKI